MATQGTTVQIEMPTVGESVNEGIVLEWLVQVGDTVAEGQDLVEMSTDKVDAPVPSTVAGVVTKLLVEVDQTVTVGQPLCEIEAGDAPAAPEPSSNGSASDDGAAPEGGGEIVDVTLPEMGDSVVEGTLLEWVVKVGDQVSEGDDLAEMSTDKIDAALPAPVSGTVIELLAEPDETVAVGAVLCRIEAGAGAAPSAPAPAAEDKPAAAPAATPTPSGNGDANATPVAARFAADQGVDTSKLTGTGPRGRVTKADVQNAATGNGAGGAKVDSAPPAPVPEGAETTVIRGPAATLARFMDQSRSIPTATSFRTLSVGELADRRAQLKGVGKKLSFTHLIAWAIVRAAGDDMPVMANSFTEVDGKPHRVTPSAVSLGLAVDAERKDGSRTLIVPVIKNASAMSFDEFVAAYDEAVFGARDNKLGPDAYAGANITLTNPGGIGTVASVPRLMPGQGTIVATGSIAFPPGMGAVDPATLAELGVQKVMTMTSTYDHRVIQGAESGAFLKRVDELLSGQDDFYGKVFAALGVDAAHAQGSADGDAAVTSTDPVPAVAPAAGGAVDEALLQAVQAATSVVKAHRMQGHLAARLDPLGSVPRGDPALLPESVDLTPELMQRIPASVLRMAVAGKTFADALPHLSDTYCGTIAYEIEHIAGPNRRVWLRKAIESGEFRVQPGSDERKRLLRRLSEVEALEKYLHKAFLGKKQFSIEGLDAMVPMLDEAIELTSQSGAREVILGMAHRGRLNVLAHTVGRPYESILVEFEGEQTLSADTAAPEGGTGDVKYHYGAKGTYKTQAGKDVTVTLAPNPSHLEYVNPVIEGSARADQTSRNGRELSHDPSVVVPVLIHGDASFPGQGIVAETLNLQALAGYSTGGTIHIIANNQLGFTTDPNDSRSTRHASDLAKGFDLPIIHVNADDVEACIAAMRLAVAFRNEFGRDVLIDLVGYRRFGHNETDEPAYTQPQMYEAIKAHPPAREVYAKQLEEQNVVSAADAESLAAECYESVAAAHTELKETMAGPPDTGRHEIDTTMSREPKTTLPEDTLRSLNEQLLRVPDGFTVHRKLKPFLDRRRAAAGEDTQEGTGGRVDWAHAESLAFASLLALGVPVRMTGQDTERGTFSQRHLVFHDSENGDRFTPLQNISSAVAPFELHNSPLSEQACVGFEYGYSAADPEALVLWEAQFGDFVNSAQVILDQFLVSGLAKWGATSRLTLLLPHGYEGSGPEHSSGRIERFLQACAEGNMRVANTTTPAQYFHLLRRQALVSKARPLVLMTPKSLLRLPAATSSLEDLYGGGFQRVLDDPAAPEDRTKVTKLVLCSGKVYYDIAANDDRDTAGSHRRGPGRDALPLPRRGAAGAHGQLPQPRARGVGAGGAAQHGPARLHAPADGGHPARGAALLLRGPPAARGPERGLLRGAPQGAGAHRARGAGPGGRRARARRLRRAAAPVPAEPLAGLAAGPVSGAASSRTCSLDA